MLRTGIDIVEIQRVREAIEHHGVRFINRLFTERERLYCEARPDPAVHYAGRWAVKEALYKALATQGEGLPFTELEVVNDTSGRPEVHLQGDLAKRFEGYTLSVSISHCRSYATAMAVALRLS